MKLHLDQEAFRVLIDTIHTQTGYRGDVLEKDYYVSLFDLVKSHRASLILSLSSYNAVLSKSKCNICFACS